MDALAGLEAFIISRLSWPSWALRLIAGLLSLVLTTGLLEQFCGPAAASAAGHEPSAEPSTGSAQSNKKHNKSKAFRWFQAHYLSVYLITMLADWLQGTNMYTLYSSYGVDVGTLFLTGFLSSAVFGTFLGIYVDTWGRRTGCILFFVLEVVINLLEHIPWMPALLLGRVLGGLSTSLLFTAFESWMVSEHRRRGFDEELLANTFSLASAGNGMMAIIAGLFAQVASDVSGDIGPFQAAIFLTLVGLVLVLPWSENYGSEHAYQASPWAKLTHSMGSSLQIIRSNPSICILGLSQAFFEGAVYTFVFLWVPSLISLSQGVSLPTGLVFTAFMLAMTFGGMITGLLLPLFPGHAEGLSVLIYLLAAMAMAVPIYAFNFPSLLTGFLVLEAMVGMFNTCGATLRSKYYPEGMQSSIMSVFRLPLNGLVVLGTKLANAANKEEEMKFVFGVIVMMHWVALMLQITLCLVGKPVQATAAATADKGVAVVGESKEEDKKSTKKDK